MSLANPLGWEEGKGEGEEGEATFILPIPKLEEEEREGERLEPNGVLPPFFAAIAAAIFCLADPNI